jgi:hypothetical protein
LFLFIFYSTYSFLISSKNVTSTVWITYNKSQWGYTPVALLVLPDENNDMQKVSSSCCLWDLSPNYALEELEMSV